MKYTLSKGLTNSPDARLIRQSVFVEEQGFEYEFDDIDETALHLVLYDENDNPCATGRLFFDDCMKIGRIAVMKEYRGQSLGSEVIVILEEKALEYILRGLKIQGVRKVVLLIDGANENTKQLCLSLGFHFIGKQDKTGYYYEAAL